jgi:hypothetical protein
MTRYWFDFPARMPAIQARGIVESDIDSSEISAVIMVTRVTSKIGEGGLVEPPLRIEGNSAAGQVRGGALVEIFDA